MTISTTTARTTYNGNGITTVFSIPFRFLANGDIVVVSVSAVGVETTKALTTHYTLSGAGDDAGGTVTMLVAPAVGTRLIIYRDTDIVQETDYISGDPFPAETHERAIDRLTMIAQEIGSDADRAIKVPVGDSSSLSTTLPAALDRLDKFVVFDLTTGATELSTVSQTQVASAVAAAYAAGSTADAVTFLQEGAGAVARSVQSRLRDTVSLADFGADPTGVADSATAINAAIAALPTYGGTIEVPYGTIRHDSAITCTKRINLVGQGSSHQNSIAASEFLKGAGVAGTGWTFSGGTTIIEKISFRGEAGNTGDGVVIAATRCAVRDCGFVKMGRDGLRIGTDSGGENNNLFMLDNIKTESNGRDGIRISEGAGALADANAGTVMNADSKSNGGAGLYLGGSQLCTVIGGAYQSNGTYGIHFSQYASHHSVFGGDLENNTTAQLRIDTGGIYNVIVVPTISYADLSIQSTTEPNRIEVRDHNQTFGGITFPATQVPSTNPNTLDDYEEGTFTPTVIGASAAGVGTYTTQIGRYTKIGRLVNFSITVIWTAHTGTGNTEVGTLPITAATISGNLFPVNIIQTGGPVPGAGKLRVAYIDSGGVNVVMREVDPATNAVANSNAITATGSLYISGSYSV